MFLCQTQTGRKNIAGYKLRVLRQSKHWSQNDLAVELNNMGLQIDKNAVQRMESGQRFIADIELFYLARLFGLKMDDFFLFQGEVPDDVKLNSFKEVD